jgi:hypothetical protein
MQGSCGRLLHHLGVLSGKGIPSFFHPRPKYEMSLLGAVSERRRIWVPVRNDGAGADPSPIDNPRR